jgi:hypothetical protein
MFICIIYTISEFILKIGTLTSSIFNSNTSTRIRIGYEELFERSKSSHQILGMSFLRIV